jgi:hypothetical protein
MTRKIAVEIAILAALVVSIASGQNASCDCDWLQTNYNTIQNLMKLTESGQWPSFNVEEYLVGPFVYGGCGDIGIYGKS